MNKSISGLALALALINTGCTSNASLNSPDDWYAGTTLEVNTSDVNKFIVCITNEFNTYGVSSLHHFSAYYYPTSDGSAVQLKQGGANLIVANVDVKTSGSISTKFQYLPFGLEHSATNMVNNSINKCGE